MYIEPRLESMPPGPELSAVLAGVDRSRLNGYDLVVVMAARARQVAYEQAQLLADMNEVACCPPGGVDAEVARVNNISSREYEFVACEISAALQCTRSAAEAQLGLATALAGLPVVHQALATGRIDMARAKVIVTGLTGLPDPVAAAIAVAAVTIGANLTSGQLRARLAALVIRTDPGAAKRRYQHAVGDRKLVTGSTGDHTAYLSGCDLPPERAAAIYARIGAIADELKRGGDERTVDQLRADVYLDILEGRDLPAAAAARPGVVDLVVPLTTLAALSEEPGVIPGFGPVIAEIARQVAARGPHAWRYRVVDRRGRLLHRGALRSRPRMSVGEEYAFVRARDQHCRYPTCRTPASRCDVDHTVQRQAGGGHTRDNLAVVCRHHHRAKDEGGYGLRQLGDGALQWTTPLGHTYTSDPEPPF